MPLLRSLRIFFVDVLQICRAYGAGFADDRPANPGARIFKGTADDSLSPWGVRPAAGRVSERERVNALRKLAQGWLVAPELDEGGSETALGNWPKIIHAEGVAEILSRSRKVRTQIPNKTNFVTARDDGQKANSLPGCTHFGITRTLIPQKFVWHATG